MINQPVLRCLTSCVLVVVFCLPSVLSAQSHVVSPADLQKELLSAAAARQRNIQSLTGFLSSTPKAQKILESAGIDPAQVKTAVSSLDDRELARLAARVEQAQSDFAAGRLSDRDLIWILVAIAALILIIVAVR